MSSRSGSALRRGPSRRAGGAGSPAPGYYPDPSGVMRWWDGSRWTDRVQNSGPPPPASQPPKKSHTVRNILLALVAVGVLAIGGCIAFLAVAANEVNDAIETAEAQDSAPGAPTTPSRSPRVNPSRSRASSTHPDGPSRRTHSVTSR
ncbi:DUF2510 domain-containing protein [Rhodococcus pyridinivorans]|uniref:DUF2510 domain-containing protein n=1 Tax=Rhodococcus pyridinivorans TaxID=103816 RepID=UPI0039C8EC76